MSTFRRPRLLSRATALGAVMAACRLTGLSRAALHAMREMEASPGSRAMDFAGYEPTEHDVFAAVFHKSGTNWLLQIVQQIAWLGEAEFDHIHDVVPWPEAPFPGVVGLDDPARAASTPSGPRAIKTALGAQFVPYSEKAKYLHLVRDPKEVAVSSYIFITGVLGLRRQVSLEHWLTLFTGGAEHGAWPAHTAGFWAWRDRPNVLSLQFAELKCDLPGNVRRIADFLGVELTDAQTKRVEERASFAWMKQNEDRFGPPLLPFVAERDRPLMIRRGVAGGSGELLSRAQQAEIDRHCMTELSRLGSDFPYRDLFDVVE